MNIHINGKAYSIEQAIDQAANLTVGAALKLHFEQPQQSTFAVALNGDFVGKDEYESKLLKSGDSLDVLQPIQGG